MKKFAVIIITLLSAISCTNLDEIREQLRDHEQRIEHLEKQCRELNSNIEAVQKILQALQEHDYVTEVMKIMEDGVEVGYSITFAKGATVTIYHGTDGTAGSAPNIGIKKASDGGYYWTVDDEWLTDDNGNMIPATVSDPDGGYVTPQFRVADGVWYVSYDNGNSWREISPAAEGEDDLFQNVTYDQNYVYITLADGSQFKIPYVTDTKVVDLFIFMGQSNMSGRGVASQAPQVPEGWGYEYKAISDPGKLLHMTEPFGLNEDNASSGVDDSNGENGTKRKGSSVSALTIAYHQYTGVPVVGVSCSKGGTSTTFWKVGGKPLNDAIARQLEAENWLKENGYTIRNNYMFWLQGESDNSMAPDVYKSNLISIVREMIEKTGVTNCMMLRVGQQNTATATKKNNIIEAQTELCQTYTEFVMASTLIAGFPDAGLMKDTWHYTQEGYNILGTDAGKNVAFYANNGIEPNMYDPYYQGLYYPINKYTSIFDNPIVPDGYTTVGTARTLVKIVDSYQDFTFVNGYTFGGGSDRNFKQGEGRATSISEILRVSGGEIVGLLQPIEGVELTYGMTEFVDKPCTVETLTSQGQKAVDWLNGDVTLQDDTRYIIVTFKKSTTTAFTDSELQLLKEALKVRHEIPEEVDVKTYTPHVELGALSTLGVWARNFYERQYYRTPRYMRVTDSAVDVAVQEDCDVRVCQYDADYKFIKIIDFTPVKASEAKTFSLASTCEYIRLVFRKDSSLPDFALPEVAVSNVEEKEYFELRPSDEGYQKILAHIEVDGEILPDYGVVCLPETYSNVGEPTRLIIFCHGAAVNYPSSVSRFVASDINPEYWLKEGYAIMDIEGNPFDNTNEHFYIPQAIQCYKAAYDWVTTTYNIRTDGVFRGGRSMGGGMCFEILRSDIPVIAACPVVPACNQLWYWNYASADRKTFCSEKMGFTGTQPAWTSNKKLTDAEYDYLYANFDQMLACSPFWSGIENLPSKDELFSVGRVSANAAYDEAEANLYSTLKFRAKAPVKIFTCYEDTTVPYRRNAELMYNMMVNAGMECELSLVHTDASTPHRYEQQDSNANITVTTRYGETMSAPWVYVDMVKFWRKYE